MKIYWNEAVGLTIVSLFSRLELYIQTTAPLQQMAPWPMQWSMASRVNSQELFSPAWTLSWEELYNFFYIRFEDRCQRCPFTCNFDMSGLNIFKNAMNKEEKNVNQKTYSTRQLAANNLKMCLTVCEDIGGQSTGRFYLLNVS